MLPKSIYVKNVISSQTLSPTVDPVQGQSSVYISAAPNANKSGKRHTPGKIRAKSVSKWLKVNQKFTFSVNTMSTTCVNILSVGICNTALGGDHLY